MQNVSLTTRGFRRPADFSITKILSGSFGVFSSGRKHRIRLQFDPYAARLVSERTWHESQRIRSASRWLDNFAARARRPGRNRAMDFELGQPCSRARARRVAQHDPGCGGGDREALSSSCHPEPRRRRGTSQLQLALARGFRRSITADTCSFAQALSVCEVPRRAAPASG